MSFLSGVAGKLIGELQKIQRFFIGKSFKKLLKFATFFHAKERHLRKRFAAHAWRYRAPFPGRGFGKALANIAAFLTGQKSGAKKPPLRGAGLSDR